MLADFFNYQLKRFPYQPKPKSVDPLRNEYDRTHPFFWATPPPSIQLFPSNLIITSDEGATPYAAHIIGVKLSTGSNRLFLQFFHGVRQKIGRVSRPKDDLWICGFIPTPLYRIVALSDQVCPTAIILRWLIIRIDEEITTLQWVDRIISVGPSLYFKL